MLKFFILFAFASVCAGCQTIEERLASRVGCDAKTVKVTNQLHVPAYTQYNFTCDKKKYTCRDAPFYSNCNEGDTVEEKGAKKKG